MGRGGVTIVPINQLLSPQEFLNFQEDLTADQHEYSQSCKVCHLISNRMKHEFD